jgi:hypothetical protein
MKPDRNGLVSLKQAADFLGIDPDVLRGMMLAGHIAFERSGGEHGSRRLRPETVLALREKMSQATSDSGDG